MNNGYGMLSDGTCARLLKINVKTNIENRGLIIAHQNPKMVCLYKTFFGSLY